MLILIFVISLVPVLLIYGWLRKRKGEDAEYKKICTSALKREAFLCPVLVAALSAIFYVIERILVVLGAGTVVIEIYHNFILLALAEELVKYWAVKGLIKKNPYAYSRIAIITFMMIIGIGFEITESLVYTLGANAGMMLARGLTVMHCGYGFLMGYFVAKGMETGKKKYTLIGILLPFMLHGLYDCCLSNEIGKINENVVYVSLTLAVVAILTIIAAICYIYKAKDKSELNAEI